MIDSDQVKKTVLDQKPVFKKILETHGSGSLFNYWKNNIQKPDEIYSDHRKELIESVIEITEHRLGKNRTQAVQNYLSQNSFVSTADHHQLLNHPFFLSANLIQSIINKRNGLDTVMVFPCGGISIDNSSFPRGLTYHKSNGSEQRIPLFSLKDKHIPIYTLHGYSKKEFTDGKVQAILNEVYFNDNVLTQNKFREQATLASYYAWKKIPGQEKINLIYIDQESIVVNLLVKHLLTKETLIQKLLTTEQGLTVFEKQFANIIGSFSTEEEKGSFLFWAVVNGKRAQLIRRDMTLVTKNGDYSLTITSKDIISALLNEEIFPTMSLTLSILSFYYGLTLGGGFSQVNYLTDTKKAYINACNELGFIDEIKKVETIETNRFCGDILLATIGKQRFPATLLDTLLYGNSSLTRDIETVAKKITLNGATNGMMFEFYKIITGVAPEIKNKVKNPTPIINYKQKKKCLHCGNSQTNHTFEWLSQTVSILRSRFDRMIIKSFIGRGATWLAERIELPMFKFFRLIRMARFVTGDDIKPITERSLLIVNEAKRRGIELSQVVMLGRPTEYFFGTYNSRTLFFDSIPRPKHMETDSIFWLDDKLTLKKKLQDNDIPAPKGGSFSHWNDMVTAFETMQKPVIVKPRLGSRGRHTTTHIYTLVELKRAVDIAKQLCHYVIMEEHLEGSVYRATMIGGVFKGLLRGDPPRITGDGEQTIAELIAEKNKNSPDQVKAVVVTEKHLEFLARTGYTLNTVLPIGKTIDLTEKIGLAYGGYTAEMSPITHPKLIATLERAAKIVNDPVIGFDVISTDVTTDPDTTRWGIIEANSLPFINLHYEPLEGPSIDIAPYVWDLWK